MGINVSLRYGREEIHAELQGGRFLGELKPQPMPETAGLEQKVVDGLRTPIGAPPLRDLARKAQKAAIVISDHTRPLPSGRILPLICNELEEAGIARNMMTVVIGLGNHRQVTEEEKKSLMGPVYGQVRCLHSKEAGYKLMGITKRGTPVEVAAPVADADLVVALGNVELHQLAGYTGGVKAVAVGTASPRSIEHNHRLSRLTDSSLGVLDDNIVRRDMEEFAEITNLKFIINLVLNEHHNAVHVAAGDPVKAHREACIAAEKIYKVNIAEKADIVVASPGGRPKDDTVYQAQKSVRNALRAAADGGIIVVAAKCPEGFGDPEFEEWMNRAGSPQDLLDRAQWEFVLGGHKGEFVARAVQKTRIFWVSDMEPEKVRKLFFEPYGSLQGAIDEALRIEGGGARVLVMPFAGLTVPYSLDDEKAESEKKWSADTVATDV